MISTAFFDGVVNDVRELPEGERVGHLLDVIRNLIHSSEEDERIDALNIRLSPTQFLFLKTMLKRLGRVTPKDSLYSIVCAGKSANEWPIMKTVNVQICYLRNNLKGTGWTIETIHGRGYRLTISQQEFPSMGTADVGAVTSTPTYLPELNPGAQAFGVSF